MRGTGECRPRHYTAMWQVAVRGPRSCPVRTSIKAGRGAIWRRRSTSYPLARNGPASARTMARWCCSACSFSMDIRKPEQQVLYCQDTPDLTAGEVRTPGNGDTHEMLFERPGARSCAHTVAAVVDVGATFGGAGRTSNEVASKMNLEKWSKKPVFASDARECRGELTISLAAGDGGNGHPRITEEGRRFLSERLHQLSDDHLRAIFTAAVSISCTISAPRAATQGTRRRVGRGVQRQGPADRRQAVPAGILTPSGTYPNESDTARWIAVGPAMGVPGDPASARPDREPRYPDPRGAVR